MLSITIVGEGFDGDTAAGIEQADDLKILGIHQLDQIFHDDVDAVLVKVAMVAEAEEIELQALALNHQGTRDIVDNKVAEIGLSRFWAQRGKLRTIHGHKVLVLRVFVLEGLQHFGRIVIVILCVLVAQQRDTFQLLFVS